MNIKHIILFVAVFCFILMPNTSDTICLHSQVPHTVSDEVEPPVVFVINQTRPEPNTPVNVTAIITQSSGIREALLYWRIGDGEYGENTELMVKQLDNVHYKGTIQGYPRATQVSFYIVANAIDSSGRGGAEHTYLVRDTIPPAIEIVGLQNESIVNGTVSIEVNVNDASSRISDVRMMVDSDIVFNNASRPFTYNWNTTLFEDGNYTFSVSATDSENNTKSVSVVVHVDQDGIIETNQTLSYITNTTLIAEDTGVLEIFSDKDEFTFLLYVGIVAEILAAFLIIKKRKHYP